MTVEFRRRPSFDAAEYLSVSSTQSGTSQPSVALEQEYQSLKFASQLHRDTIPDSQDSEWSSLAKHPGKSHRLPSCEESGASQKDSSGGHTALSAESGNHTSSVESQIPSHQPNNDQRPLALESHTSSTERSITSPNLRQSGPVALKSPVRSPNQSNRASNLRHCFPTQPYCDFIPIDSTSSLRSQLRDSPIETAISKIKASLGSLVSQTSSYLHISQAAQKRSTRPTPSPQLTMEPEKESSSNSVPRSVSAIDQLRAFIDIGDDQDSSDAPKESQSVEGHPELVLPAPSSGLQGDSLPAGQAHHSALAWVALNESRSHGHVVPPAASETQSSGTKSAVETLTGLVDMAFSGVMPTSAEPPVRQSQGLQWTVDPAEIATSLPSETLAMPVPLTPSLISHPEVDPTNSLGFAHLEDQSAIQHIVTLPFQASVRQVYDDTILHCRASINKFGQYFSYETFTEPDEALVREIDKLLNDLRNLCDYPQAGMNIEERIPPALLAKYFCDANPKFSFIYELLKGLQKQTEILVVARSRELLKLLLKVTDALEIKSTCKAVSSGNQDICESPVEVTFVLGDEDVDPFQFDVVVGFDHAFKSSSVARVLSDSQKSPLTLILVTNYSVDHIDLHQPEHVDALERRNMILSGIVRARPLIRDSDGTYREPHQLAQSFVDYLNGDVETISNYQVAIPDEVLDVYTSSQPRSQAAVETPLDQVESRKRKHVSG